MSKTTKALKRVERIADGPAQSPAMTVGMQILQQLADAIKPPQFKDVDVVREGDRIILPVGMSYAEGRKWLQRQEDSEEKVVAVHTTVPCFPLDGAIALSRAMKEVYGFTALTNTPTMWGERPPNLIQVRLSNGEYETATLGRMQPPMYEGGFLDASCDDEDMSLIISGQIKKKFEPEVKRIIKRTIEMLKEDSIYRGSAFILDLGWIEANADFHPEKHAPVFMDVSEVDENGLILNQDTMFSLQANVFTLLERTEACRTNGIPLKHGCILAGAFGTGKTLTARVTASKAVRNGWTFIYLKTAKQLAKTLKLAEMYAPSVVFTEDIDNVVGPTRDQDINHILNTLDGVDTKDQPVITILTTNKMEDINAAFLRPGRIDTVVQFTEPDAATAIRFLYLYGRDDDGQNLIAPLNDQEKAEVGAALAGYVPAFIAEIVQKAKRVAIYEHGNDIMEKVTATHLIAAAKVLRAHKELMDGKKEPSRSERVTEAWRGIMHDAIENRKPLT